MKDIKSLDWNFIQESLFKDGFARITSLLGEDESEMLKIKYPDQSLYRNVINMERYRFGLGEYKYFSYPLPELVQRMREDFYSHLAPIANAWMSKLNIDTHYPKRYQSFVEMCTAKDQKRPTPLILKYGKGGYNTLHQDLYGDVYLPFQVVFLLSQKGKDYDGGELVFTEQVPRAQSRARVLTPDRGDAVIFTTNFRPAVGKRGYYRAA